MKGICSAATDNVDRTGRGEGGREIQRGLAKLELLHRIVGDVRQGRADRLVGNVDSIDLNASAGAAAAVNTNGAVGSTLGGINHAAVSNKNTWL